MNINGFAEKRSLAPLAIHSGSAESLRSDFGFRDFYQWQIGKILVEPSLKAACKHEYNVGALFFLGDFEAAREHAIRPVQIWRSGNVQFHTEEPYTPVVTCLCYLPSAIIAYRSRNCEWILGIRMGARERSQIHSQHRRGRSFGLRRYIWVGNSSRSGDVCSRFAAIGRGKLETHIPLVIAPCARFVNDWEELARFVLTDGWLYKDNRLGCKLRPIIGANDRDLALGTANSKDELFAIFGPNAERARSLYDPCGDQTLEELKQQVFADKTLVEPTRHFADEMARSGQPVWLYGFAYALAS